MATKRTYAEEAAFIEQLNGHSYRCVRAEAAHTCSVLGSQYACCRIKMGFVPNMRVPCTFYVNQHLQQLMFEELEQFVSRGDVGGFLPAVKQLANVAALPGARGDLFKTSCCARALPALSFVCVPLCSTWLVSQGLSRRLLPCQTFTAATASQLATWLLST